MFLTQHLKNRRRAIEVACVIGIMLLAFLLRMYHIDRLAVFLSDQAIDSYAVKDILSGDFTLLGPRASVGQFFNGPIVYYLMVPFYLFLRNDPLAGTIFQITLQIASIPFLYIVTKRFGGLKAGFMSIVIFVFSPLLISYSRATFNSYPAIFFTTVILYFITKETLSNKSLLLAGLLTGMLVQMHYFLYMYAFGYFIYVSKQSKNIKKIMSFLIGCVVGLSPFLLFELRHNFFNIRAILFSGRTITEHVSILRRVEDVGTMIGNLLGPSSSLIGVAFLLIVCFMLIRNKIDRKLKSIFFISLFVLLGNIILYKGALQTHYLIGFMMIFVVAISSIFAQVFPSRSLVLIAFIYISCFFVFQKYLFRIPTEQDGLGLPDQRKVVSYISNWKIENPDTSWNVTQDAQRDNRAMPLRYLLSLNPSLSQPMSVEEYQSNKELFVVIPTNKKIEDIRTWEVVSYGKNYNVVANVPINTRYAVVYLRKR